MQRGYASSSAADAAVAGPARLARAGERLPDAARSSGLFCFLRSTVRFAYNNGGYIAGVPFSLMKLARIGWHGGARELIGAIRHYVRRSGRAPLPMPAWWRRLRSAHRVIRHARSRHVPWVGTLRSAFFVFCNAESTSARPVPHGICNELNADQAAKVLACCPSQPVISLIIPVPQIEPRWLERSIQSVACQHYRNWQLVLVDDDSRNPELNRLMQHWQSVDPRIEAHFLSQHVGIAETTNEGIRHCQGQFIGFLDHDDELTPDALTWLVWYHNCCPQARWFYSDEDKVAEDGICFMPHLKPDFSPEYLLSSMFTCHFSVYDAGLLRQAGGLRPGFEGAQEHDLALRLAEQVSPAQVVHIPRILYHWRALSQSMAKNTAAKPDAVAAGLKAVREALARRGLHGAVAPHPVCSTNYQIALEPRCTPKTAILIATKNSYHLVRQCIEALRQQTAYPCYEIVVINNQSSEHQLLEYLAFESARPGFHVINYNRPFNHSDMHNCVIQTLDAELLVFLNNDVVIQSPRWLEQLVATLELASDVAGVGALLRYPDGRIQHGGIVLGICSRAGHAHRFLPPGNPGYMHRAVCLQELSGVTAAFMLLRRSAFLRVGGFRADRYPTSFNDVDLWFRLRQAGYRCLYNPMIEAIHHESASRVVLRSSESCYENRLIEDWGDRLDCDPFYNPNLTLDNEQFNGYRRFPPEVELWPIRRMRRAA